MRHNKRGFTLTEVLVVIVIIGIVLTIAVPSVILVRKRINKRMFEEKKSLILVAAELYGKDKGVTGDTILAIDDLLRDGYLNPDLKNGEGGCTSAYGCVVNPEDGSIITDVEILLKKTNFDVIAVWNGKIAASTSSELVDEIIDKLSCPATIPADSPCLYPADGDADGDGTPDNYLYLSGIMWRIVGVYNIDNNYVVKLITDDTVVWED